MKRKGTILTREKALEFSSGVLTEEATSGFLGMYPVFGKDIEMTEAVKEAEELRTQLNMGRKNKFSYSRGLSYGSGRNLGLEDSEMDLMSEHFDTPMFQRKLSPLHMRPHEPPGSFNYEDLTEEQAEKELGRVLEGIKPRGTPWQNFFNWENKTDNLRSWIKVKKAQLYNKRK